MSLIVVKNRIKYRGKCILMVQKIVRGFLARKQHRPRFQGIMKINSIKSNLAKTKEIASQLKINKDEILRQVQDMERLIEESIKKIKVNICKVGCGTI